MENNDDNISSDEIEEFLSNRKISRLPNKKIQGLKINVSHACNLRCSYCYAGNGDYGDKGKIMTLNTANKIAQFIEGVLKDVNTITFFGGEPTLNIEVIKFFCERYSNFNFLMQTNGVNLNNQELLNLIYKYNIKVTVSIDGNKAIHDRERKDYKGNPTYDVIRNNIAK
ncbi:MAG: radical SAM protein, partial [Culicoidibacterales bacterium]